MCSINKKIKIKTTTHKIDITNAEIPLTVIYQVVSSPMVSTQGKKILSTFNHLPRYFNTAILYSKKK